MISGGFVPLFVGLITLVVLTIIHGVYAMIGKGAFIEDGGAPPFLMTLFIGGVQISLMLTIVQMIAALVDSDVDLLGLPETLTKEQKDDKTHRMRTLLVWSMITKMYVVQFLRNSERVASNTKRILLLVSIVDRVNVVCSQTRNGLAPPKRYHFT